MDPDDIRIRFLLLTSAANVNLDVTYLLLILFSRKVIRMPMLTPYAKHHAVVFHLMCFSSQTIF